MRIARSRSLRPEGPPFRTVQTPRRSAGVVPAVGTRRESFTGLERIPPEPPQAPSNCGRRRQGRLVAAGFVKGKRRFSQAQSVDSHHIWIRRTGLRLPHPTGVQSPATGHREAVASISTCIKRRRKDATRCQEGPFSKWRMRASFPDPATGIRGFRTASLPTVGAAPSSFSGAFAVFPACRILGRRPHR